MYYLPNSKLSKKTVEKYLKSLKCSYHLCWNLSLYRKMGNHCTKAENSMHKFSSLCLIYLHFTRIFQKS